MRLTQNLEGRIFKRLNTANIYNPSLMYFGKL